MPCKTTIQNYRRLDAFRIKDGKVKVSPIISFKYDNQVIKTSDSVVQIGQTSNWIFLYEVKDSITHAYSMSKITELDMK